MYLFDCIQRTVGSDRIYRFIGVREHTVMRLDRLIIAIRLFFSCVVNRNGGMVATLQTDGVASLNSFRFTITPYEQLCTLPRLV